MKPRSICFNFSPSPFCKHDEPECHLKSLDIDDLNSAAQSLNPIVTLAMVELHPSSSQLAPHAKNKTQGDHEFFACPWSSIIFSQIAIEFLKMCFWDLLFNWGFGIFVHKVIFNLFFLMKYLVFFSLNVVEIFVHKVLLIFFLMICFSNFSLVYLGNIDSWNFSLQNLGYVCFNYFEVVYVHWVIAKGVQSQALLGIQRNAMLHNDGGFEAPTTLHCHCDCQNDNVCCYTIVGECFCQTTFFMGCCQKGLDISGTKYMCNVWRFLTLYHDKNKCWVDILTGP